MFGSPQLQPESAAGNPPESIKQQMMKDSGKDTGQGSGAGGGGGKKPKTKEEIEKEKLAKQNEEAINKLNQTDNPEDSLKNLLGN